MYQKERPKDRASAILKGWSVRTDCYPWVAYRGPQDKPTEACDILTDKEIALFDIVVSVRPFLDMIPVGGLEAASNGTLNERGLSFLKKTIEQETRGH